MSGERWRRLRDIYDAVADADAGDRNRLVDELCADDPDLKPEVLALLAAASTPDTFLDTPPAHLLTPDLSSGDVLCDRFLIRRLLGRGGMGDVWAADDRALTETVAIKTIGPAFVNDAQGLARFKQEIQLARRVAHPNVCRVHELFEDRSGTRPRFFLTMELVEGETLAARLKREGPFDYNAALQIIRPIVAGLTAAHAAGVVHRDLKPANIMLSGGETVSRVIVMDFGLARIPDTGAGAARSVTRVPMGTPEYMAPEQITGAGVSPATDVYALGLMLFEILSGSKPFRGSNTFDSFMRRAREGPRKLSGEISGVPPRADSVIARCLEYDPAKRFTAAADVLGALESSWPILRAGSGRRALIVAGSLAIVASGTFGAKRLWNNEALVTPDAVRWYTEAQQALAEGASVRALNDITRAINTAPGFAPAHAALAEILLEMDMPVRAQEAMLNASQLAPNRRGLAEDDLQYVSGIQHLLLRNCDAALAQLQARSSHRAAPDGAYRLLTTARAFDRCDRAADAERALAEAAGLDDRNAAVPLRRARLLARRPDYPGAMAALNQAEALFRDRNNVEGLGEVLATRGAFEAEQELLAAADATLKKAGDIALSLDDVRQQVRVLLYRAVVRRKQGEISAADVLTSQAIALAQRHGLETLTLEGLFTAANVHVVRNQFPEAQALFEQALAIADTHRHDAFRARARLSLATVFVRVMEPEKAASAVLAARPYFERIGHKRNLRIADTLMGQIRMMRGQYVEAIDQYSAAATAAHDQGDREQEAIARENLASAQVGAGRYVDALTAYHDALAMHRAAGRTRSVVFALLNSSDTLSRLGQFSEAAATMKEAIGQTPLPTEIESQMLRIKAADALRQGRYDVARSAAQDAGRLAAKLSQERTLRAQLIMCRAAARSGRHAEARGLCDGVTEQVSHGGHLALRLEAALSAAEAAVLAGDKRAAAGAIAEAGRLISSAEHEDWWRLLALAAASGSSLGDRESPSHRLARELDALRLKWGERNYERWSQRSDVRHLTAAAGVNIGGNHR